MLSVPILIAFLTITVVPGPPVSVAASVPLPLASSLATLASNLTATNNATTGDGFILNFALTLEYLQRAFYVSGLNNFTHSDFTTAGFLDPFYDDLVQISNEEQSHIDFLVEALEAADIEATLPLEYMFPYMDVSAFVSLSSIIEGVSVSAYLGAATSIDDPDYLTALNSILSIEARHESYLRAGLGESPFPNAFDTSLDFNETHTIAVGFITNFQDSAVPLPVVPFPNLTLACTPYFYEEGRSSITFSNAFTDAQELGVNYYTPVYAVFFSGLMKLPVRTRVLVGNTDYKIDNIPTGVVGQSYVVLSRSDTDFSDASILAGPAVIEVYPTGGVPDSPHTGCP